MKHWHVWQQFAEWGHPVMLRIGGTFTSRSAARTYGLRHSTPVPFAVLECAANGCALPRHGRSMPKGGWPPETGELALPGNDK